MPIVLKKMRYMTAIVVTVEINVASQGGGSFLGDCDSDGISEDGSSAENIVGSAWATEHRVQVTESESRGRCERRKARKEEDDEWELELQKHHENLKQLELKLSDSLEQEYRTPREGRPADSVERGTSVVRAAQQCA
eukprot:TRINITY_DN2764_c0_g2_i2.p1 TRINITY_DN2764_c0_g2~~TRINITY_DN2764_c0_g2_i2.p1  ORF type:complete len:137 (-),score=15.81 TRINITY_DN2764_c0_g2_i2:986-1396(-)